MDKSVREESGGVPLLILETSRLRVRELNNDDADFILTLLNEPSFIRFIGDKNVRSRRDAEHYIQSGPVQSYKENGFGLYLVELKSNTTPIGICGLLKRAELPDPDIGFAFLPDYWASGYAYESAAAIMSYAKDQLQIERILAITSPDNEKSGSLLEKIGLTYQELIRLTDDQPAVKLFVSDTKRMDSQ